VTVDHDPVPPNARPRIDVDVWSDVVCPWCYIGKRRFEAALDRVADEFDVRITYRPFQLDPGADPSLSGPARDAYERKFGGAERAQQIFDHVTGIAAGSGLDFHLDDAKRANTMRAHRLLWLAQATGHQGALKERLLHAYFTDGLDIGDIDTLAGLASEVGLPSEQVRTFLLSDDGTEEVLAQIRWATEHDITAVPTYVFSGVWQVPGAQDADTFETVLRRVAERLATAEHDG
jgi:predicted DsbA family dithiol-disulfide isomerase